MPIGPRLALSAGALIVAVLGYGAASLRAPAFAERLDAATAQAIAATGVAGIEARFVNRFGMATRHPLLIDGAGHDDDARARVARAVAAVDGVGGVSWADAATRAEAETAAYEPRHCQEDVEGLLRTRSVRFEEASSALLPASELLLDEVATALRPCLGSIIAITGHTDALGNEPGNLALSLDRARAVREALLARGIPRDGLRARGLGSQQPVEGLTPDDPANRRIEFSVIRTVPLRPTPIDTPGAR